MANSSDPSRNGTTNGASGAATGRRGRSGRNRRGPTGRRSATGRPHDLDQPVVRERVGRDAVAPDDRRRGDERVDDRLLGRLDDGIEQLVDGDVADGADGIGGEPSGRRRRPTGGIRLPVANAMNRSPLVWPPVPPTRAIPRPARCASRSHWWGSSGASVATTTMIEPEPAGGVAVGSRRLGRTGSAPRRPGSPRRPARRRPAATPASRSSPGRGRRPCSRRPPSAMTRDAVPMPPLNSWQTTRCRHRPRPPRPVHRAPPPGPPEGAPPVTWNPFMSFRSPSYVSPTTGSDQRASLPVDRGGDQRVAHDPDAVRVGDRDRRGQQARFADPFEAGHLAVAVEAMAAGEHGLAQRRPAARADDRDAGPDRAPADDQRSVAADQRRVPDRDAGDVGDGVERPG